MANPWDSPSSSSDLRATESLDAPRGLFSLASFGQRAVAWLIDIVILASINELLFRVNPTDANGIAALLDLGYMVLLLGGPYGQTIGAKVMKIRVVNINGKPLGYLRATARYLLASVSAIILGLGYLWMLRDKRNQTLHDKLAGSLVISLLPRPGLEPAEIVDPPSHPNL